MTARPIHLVGIGGAGMSGLARLAAEAGYRVTGSDRDESPTLAALRAAGVDARAGHDRAAVPADAAAVVVSTAIAAGNPEVAEARRRGLPVLHRSELLAELMGGRRGLAVAGAHGKSTTSAMLAAALGGASACVGATIAGGEGTGAAWGAGPWFVVEADESDRSLLNLAPEAAILLNVDHDHHATFATIEDVRDVFRAFVARLPPAGLLVVGPDDEARACAGNAACAVRRVGDAPGDWGQVARAPERPGFALVRADGRRVPPAGLLVVGPDDEARACAGGAACAVRLVGDAPGDWGQVERAPERPGFALVRADGRRVEVPLRLAGRHNADNAACALALADWCGVPPERAAARLAGFAGVGRRMEPRGRAGGVEVVDDYAHHPAEIRATLAAARERGPTRVVVVFQPHLPSRTRALGPELAEALGAADVVVVTDVYLAREPADPRATGRAVAERVPAPARAVHAATLADAADAALAEARPGDLLITMGAGDVTLLGEELVARLEKQSVDGDPDDRSRPA